MFKKPVPPPVEQEARLTHLDAIRQAEAEVAARILLARQKAEERKQSAREEARLIVEQAEQDGERAGKEQYERLSAESAREAGQILAEARASAQAVECEGQALLDPAALWAVNVVLGLEQKEREP